VDFNKIEDLDLLESWLKNHDAQISRAFAARAALRSLPSATSFAGKNSKNLNGDMLVLSLFRSVLVTGAASYSDNGSSLVNAAQSAHKRVSGFSSLATSRAASAVLSVFSESPESAAVASVFSPNPRSLATNLSDIQRSLNSTSGQIFASPLWPSKPTSAPTNEWEEFTKLSKQHLKWLFWTDWYQGFLDGKPLDWELQRRVALIDDAIWDAGPEAVAKEIERIRAKFELEKEVAALKEQLSTQQQALARNPQIGDNGGPPLDGANAKAFKKDLVLVWSDLEELETELEMPEPSPSILKRIAQSLSETALRVAAYCGATMDVSVKSAAKAFGTTLGPIGATEIAKPGSIDAVAKAIGKFLTALAN